MDVDIQERQVGQSLKNCDITQVCYIMPNFNKQMQSNVSQNPEQIYCSTQRIVTVCKQMQETIVKMICVNLKCNASTEKDPKFINASHWR